MESHDDHADDDHDDFGGLAADLPRVLGRRRAITLLGGMGLATLVAACNGSSTTSTASTTTTSSKASGSSASSRTSSSSTASTGAVPTSAIPEETAGPFPGDGSNGPDVLNQSGIVRADIRPSFGSYSGTAEGVPLTIALRVLDLKNAAAALVGAAVYTWHCDRDGQYSLYTVQNQNYLRGVQATDDTGTVSFTSIFPGCYSGRWPHVHFEVYPSLAAATSTGTKLKTSQLALPEDVCRTVYATAGYGQSVTNLSRVSLSTDMVFSDGWSSELAALTGDTTNGYTANLVVAV